MALTTMYPAKNNSPTTVLAASLNSSDTVMVVEDASVLPSAPNLVVIGNSTSAEIVLYTAIDENSITIVRGQNGTIPGTWPAETPVARNFTAADHEAFRENILDLDNRKIEGVDWGDIGGALADQTDLKSALDAKQGTLEFDSVPTSGSDKMVKSGGIYSALAKEIMYFTAQAVGTSSSTSTQIMRIPATGTNSNITTNTIVLSCVFASPSNVTSDVTWQSYAGYVSFAGTCTAATTASVVLGTKGN